VSAADEIKSRLDIVDFISGYVPSLKRAGKTYKGLCPFHSEKTPSFVVYPDQQTWHCYGACSTGGDIFSFVMKREGYDFVEALKVLAAKAGVPLEERSPEATEADQRQKKLLEMVAVTAQFFHRQLLQSPQAEFCREYVARRGLSQKTIVAFQLGYAPNQWEALKTFLLQRGYSEQDMIAGGVLVTKEENRPGYDRFRDRFVVPIRDVRGRVVGFGARALRDGQQPKYLNSPQSILFDKSAILFGLDVAKSAIRDLEQAVIVEGYMDALQAHEHGFGNVVAEMGTALTERQLKQLKRFTPRFVLALDSDNAGSTATLRGINLAREALSETVVPIPTPQGLIRYEGRLDAEIYVATMPVGKDPDDVLRQDPSLWKTAITQAMPLVDYYIQSITSGVDLTTAKGKSGAIKEIMPLLREISSPVEQAHYLQQLARLVTIDERTLRAELQRAAGPTPSLPPSPAIPFAEKTGLSTNGKFPPVTKATDIGAEELCLAMIVGKPEMLSQMNRKLFDNGIDVLAVADFVKRENGELFLGLKQWAVTEHPTTETLLASVPTVLQGHLAAIMTLWHEQPQKLPDEYVQKELPKMVVRMRRRRLERDVAALNMSQIDALEAGDRTQASHFQQLISEIKTTLKLLDKAYDALSIMGRRRTE